MENGDGPQNLPNVRIRLSEEDYEFLRVFGLSQDIPVSITAVATKWLTDRIRSERFLRENGEPTRERRSRVGDRRTLSMVQSSKKSSDAS